MISDNVLQLSHSLLKHIIAKINAWVTKIRVHNYMIMCIICIIIAECVYLFALSIETDSVTVTLKYENKVISHVSVALCTLKVS